MADTPEAMRGGPDKTVEADQAAAGRTAEPGARETSVHASGAQPNGQESPQWQADAATRGTGAGTGAAEMEREA